MKYAILAAMAASLALAGCNIGGTTVTLPTAAQVITAVQQGCSYTPLLTDVQAVLNAEQQAAAAGDVATAQSIAAQVCAAIASVQPPAAGKEGAAPVTAVTVVVNGKPIVVHVSPK